MIAELQRLESIERPKASAAIAEARDKGDLSENSEYDAAKEVYLMLGEFKDSAVQVIRCDTQKKQVEKDRELFKKRIRAMYVHGNDGILSALVGATSFYDILSRVDIVKRISKHDNEIINRLRDEINTLTKSEQDLTASLQSLNIQETEMPKN